MALFQQAVLKKYINVLGTKSLSTVWARYQLHFHDPEKQEHIRNLKEEQYQEGFLSDLFADVLD
jgi:hypothetical protein